MKDKDVNYEKYGTFIQVTSGGVLAMCFSIFWFYLDTKLETFVDGFAMTLVVVTIPLALASYSLGFLMSKAENLEKSELAVMDYYSKLILEIVSGFGCFIFMALLYKISPAILVVFSVFMLLVFGYLKISYPAYFRDL